MDSRHPNTKPESSKVHFPASQVEQHNAEIVVEPEGDGRIGVHLGFLKINYHYELRFCIRDQLYEDLTADPLQNLNCKLVSIEPTEDGEGHAVVIDFKACKEKLMREQLVLTEARPGGAKGKSLTLVLHARVLGKGKGTPSVKTGIHILGIDVDEDSEQSDWCGFK